MKVQPSIETNRWRTKWNGIKIPRHVLIFSEEYRAKLRRLCQCSVEEAAEILNFSSCAERFARERPFPERMEEEEEDWDHKETARVQSLPQGIRERRLEKLHHCGLVQGIIVAFLQREMKADSRISSLDEIKQAGLRQIEDDMSPEAHQEVIEWSQKEVEKRLNECKRQRGALSSADLARLTTFIARDMFQVMTHLSNSKLYLKAKAELDNIRDELVPLFVKKMNAEQDSCCSMQQNVLKTYPEIWESIGGTAKIFDLFDCKPEEIPWEPRSNSLYLAARGVAITHSTARPAAGNILDWQNLKDDALCAVVSYLVLVRVGVVAYRNICSQNADRIWRLCDVLTEYLKDDKLTCVVLGGLMKRAYDMSKGLPPKGFGEVSKKNSKTFFFSANSLHRRMWLWLQFYRSQPTWARFVETKRVQLVSLHNPRSNSASPKKRNRRAGENSTAFKDAVEAASTLLFETYQRQVKKARHAV